MSVRYHDSANYALMDFTPDTIELFEIEQDRPELKLESAELSEEQKDKLLHLLPLGKSQFL